MKLLLVDDEPIVLTGISTILETDKGRFQILAQCGNGFEALEAIHRERPDVVITDIRMNGMNGLELTEKIREIDERILVILLTGYPDFVFAQKAIALGAFDYLVKPTRYADIIKCLDRAEKKLYRLRTEALTSRRLMRQVEDNWEDLTGKLMQDIMKGFVVSEQEIKIRAEELNISVGNFMVINVRFEAWCHTFSRNIRDKFSLNYALRNMFKEIFDRFDQLFFILESIDNFVLLLSVPDNQEESYAKVAECAGDCARLAMELLETHLIIGLSGIHDGLPSLQDAYEQSLAALKSATVSGLSFASYGREHDGNNIYSPAIKKALAYIHEHFCEDISLKLVSKEVFLNTWYFSELFKKEMGKPFTEYILNLRITKAKTLIEDRHLPLYQIAYMVGINGPGYFSQVFKRLTGLTPKEYRKQMQKR